LENVRAALDLAAWALNEVVGPDRVPVLSGEDREGRQVRLGPGKYAGYLRERGGQRADDLLVLDGDGFPHGLAEDRGDQGTRGFGAGRPQLGSNVAGEVHATPLPGGSGQDYLDGGFDTADGVTSDHSDPSGSWSAACIVPGLMEAVNTRKDHCHECTEEES
jgi:hypothetical protein